jgi:DNA ligase (NAD+)
MHDPVDIAAEIRRLRSEVARHEELYRLRHEPEISDQAYDRLVRELRALEEAYPLFAAPDSPTRSIGDDRSPGFTTARHLEPMLSLDNTYSRDELAAFDQRLCKALALTACTYVVEPKIDGLAISLTYAEGRLQRAVTRGNGVEGDDVTANVRTIRELPPTLPAAPVPDLIEIRGEVYMTVAEFDRINAARAAAGQPLYMNPRNLASGTLKLLDPQQVAERRLAIVCYGVGHVAGMEFQRQSAIRGRFAAWGLPVLERDWQATGIDAVWAAIGELDQARAGFAYATDGAVIKLDDRAAQRRAGATAKSPRWAISYKFAAAQAETVLRGITLQIGRTGTLTPVAELEPVLIGGSMVSRATLHNEDEIRRKDIREGDTVVVEKAGEVIPAVVRARPEKRPPDAQPFTFAQRVAELGLDAARAPGQAAWRLRCSANPEQLRRRLAHFAGRNAMDIDGLGEEIIRQLVAAGLVRDLPDLYRLNRAELLALEGFADKSTDNLLNAIDASRGNDLWRLLHGLGIPHVGAQSARDLARHFATLDQLAAATDAELQAVDGIGPVMAAAIVAWFADPANRERLHRLTVDAGCNTRASETAPAAGPLHGKTFVLTGTLPSLTRDEAAALITAAGGTVVGSVSNKTDYVVAGASAGSKLARARALNVPVLDENGLRARLAAGS